MGIHFTDDRAVALYDSVSGMAFGPTFSSGALAEDFIQWAKDKKDIHDLRGVAPAGFVNLHSEWFDDRLDAATGELKD